MTNAFHLTKDGNKWCAVLPTFDCLATSAAGFGDTASEAIADLCRYVTDENAKCFAEAKAAEKNLEYENYHSRGYEPGTKEKAVARYKLADEKADKARDDYRLMRSILVPSDTIEVQINRELALMESR